MEQTTIPTTPTFTASFKDVCFKIGFVMTIFFISRILCGLISTYIHNNLTDVFGISATYILHSVLSVVFLYVIPTMAAIAVIKDNTHPSFAELYHKPPRLAKALGNFPAMYGLGQLANVLMLVIMWLIAKAATPKDAVEAMLGAALDQQEVLERSFGTMNGLIPPDWLCAIVIFIHMTVAAALFEEFIFRGLILTALKPYGNGFAIIVSAFAFGVAHGNIQQFVYTFVLGIVLGYITIQTKSILASTILHALFNSISAVMMLFLSTRTIQDWLLGQQLNGAEELSETSSVIMAGIGIYFVVFVSLLVTGVALAVRRLLRIKDFGTNAALKNDNAQFPQIAAELPTKRRTILLVTSVPVILTVILAIDAFAGGLIGSFVYRSLF
ncbi:MAG: CPBP family intramembrane metalloprotease [Oscillospiraceae bacterium]|nr:CPBP family intramembrane metalloprotease [Oscillospiraceae bacterium]